MKRWWGWVFAWLGVVGLLFSLGIKMTGVNHPGHAGWARSCTRGTFLSISSSPTLLATATQLLRSRAGPVESFVTPGALLTAADVGLPWLEYREPRGARGRPWVSGKVVGHAGNFQRAQHVPLTKFPPPQQINSKSWALVTAFS